VGAGTQGDAVGLNTALKKNWPSSDCPKLIAPVRAPPSPPLELDALLLLEPPPLLDADELDALLLEPPPLLDADELPLLPLLLEALVLDALALLGEPPPLVEPLPVTETVPAHAASARDAARAETPPTSTVAFVLMAPPPRA
jgi:hypothetical protein